ncbi:hypothetical protein GOP47_0016417 [Adiantum capillus-veneris]|uniref:YTH domain-containing protein n=1 Tax=Adiantum capillus-veneris TaxID=13818 RepID=A0A9D4UI17_ADICA|nr:hypothetical protein GOP47_0016417 [Adiantum capillus-veneris]
MAVAVVEQPMSQLCHKFDTLKIDAHRKVGDKAEFPISNQQLYPSYLGETFHCNTSIASSEMLGDGASSYCSREEYPELAYITAPNVYVPSPHGTIYTGCPSPVLNTHGYIPYQVDGLHYYNQIVEYMYGSQPVYGSVPTSFQYPPQSNDGFVYGPQVYQYPVQPYYQQPPVGQYVPTAAPSMPTGGMVVIEPQESSVVLTNGFSNYAGPIPAGPPMTFVPPVSCENALPLTVSYPPLPAVHPSHTLRASAPAWIEPAHERKGGFKERKLVEVPSGPQLSAINGVYPHKTGAATPSNGLLTRSNSTLASVKVVTSAHPAPTLPTHRVNDVKDSARPGTERVLKKDVSFSSVVSNGQESGSLPKSQPFMKPLTVVASKESCSCLPNGERYNSEDFVTKYDDAKHFIIKSYSEENVFRSIQYGVWASTPNGNKKLDDAYHDAQRRAAGKPNGCPVFLYFSVNGSRQFCGVAEMTGPVDYKRSMEFWEQHKWSGSFPLKWHFIKDVPNSQFRRIILQNNENKPVTNSRDTQEVFFQQGLEMLNIIKSYPLRTSILDEFPLCNMPIKAVPELKPQQQWSPQSFPKIGEQVVKVRNEESDVKSPRPVSTTLKVCDNGAKTTHLAKPVTGKGSPATVGQEPNMDKERRRVDKENIKFAGKDGSLVMA